jgi:hypothetical protein
LFVAGEARRVELHLTGGLPMASGACELHVRTCKRKAGFLAVVELPDRPTVGRVAAGALRSERCLVHIIALVAIDAVAGDILVLAREVALLAGHRDVQSQQREARQVMIKADVGAPPCGTMALLALSAEFPRVHVACSMTARAVRCQLLSGYRRSVTGVTLDLLVLSGERPMRIACVIERDGLPLLVAMTPATIPAEPAAVRVLRLVAADALARQLVVQIAAAVALLAIDARMDALQGETRLLLVVEPGGLPTRGRVTGAAFRPALSTMNIVGRVTGDALLRSSFVPVA